MTLKRVRKQEYGGTCAICGSEVELISVADKAVMRCKCGDAHLPQWTTIDAYARTQYLRRFELKEIPIEP